MTKCNPFGLYIYDAPSAEKFSSQLISIVNPLYCQSSERF